MAVNWALLGPVCTVEGMVVVDEEGGGAVTSWAIESARRSTKDFIAHLLEMIAKKNVNYCGPFEDL